MYSPGYPQFVYRCSYCASQPPPLSSLSPALPHPLTLSSTFLISPSHTRAFTHTHSCPHLQESFESALKHPNYSPAHSPQHLARPHDEYFQNRRPSDEASQILRKISGAGLAPMLGFNLGVNQMDKTQSLPPIWARYGIMGGGGIGMGMESSSFQDFGELARMNTLGVLICERERGGREGRRGEGEKEGGGGREREAGEKLN